LDEIQAAILRVKLRYLETENQARRVLAARYLEKLATTQLTLPRTVPNTTPVFHQFTVRIRDRENLKTYLQTHDILCGVLYPVPIHRQPAYEDHALHLPFTERACSEVLCLPCHPALTTDDVDRVAAEIVGWVRPI
jgi:dTDP-4-amino-4,6-dideoxygalactose transaminase